MCDGGLITVEHLPKGVQAPVRKADAPFRSVVVGKVDEVPLPKSGTLSRLYRLRQTPSLVAHPTSASRSGRMTRSTRQTRAK